MVCLSLLKGVEFGNHWQACESPTPARNTLPLISAFISSEKEAANAAKQSKCSKANAAGVQLFMLQEDGYWLCLCLQFVCCMPYSVSLCCYYTTKPCQVRLLLCLSGSSMPCVEGPPWWGPSVAFHLLDTKWSFIRAETSMGAIAGLKETGLKSIMNWLCAMRYFPMKSLQPHRVVMVSTEAFYKSITHSRFSSGL